LLKVGLRPFSCDFLFQNSNFVYQKHVSNFISPDITISSEQVWKFRVVVYILWIEKTLSRQLSQEQQKPEHQQKSIAHAVKRAD
jgi:hypothetical protein